MTFPFLSCNHRWSWPHTDKHTGRQYQVCVCCGAHRDSSIQFGKPAQVVEIRTRRELRPEVA